MKPEEIKLLVEKKIKGQGTNVDAASALPTILYGILDLINEGGGLPSYEICKNDSGGNVVKNGEIVIDGETYGIYELFYRTGALPATGSREYPIANLLSNYNVLTFIEATGVTDGGIVISSGRTDSTKALIVQQFSKNRKSFTIRTYEDFSAAYAYLKIVFIGKQI